jgi:hypothetical protein
MATKEDCYVDSKGQWRCKKTHELIEMPEQIVGKVKE